ncbi:MAG TPA: glycoside hydrolase family 31 protein [Candidatus Dormibacteraeota bacterium]
MLEFRESGGSLEWSGGHEVVRVEPWGEDSVRVRVGLTGIRDDLPGALLDRPSPDGGAEIEIGDGRACLRHGRLRAEVTAAGLLAFSRADSGAELIGEQVAHFWWPGPRLFTATGNGYHRIEQRFKAYDGERIFGLGQHQHGLLDQKGAVIDLVQRNAEVTIPFLLSSRGYGLLWNSPAIGRVELAGNGTRWVADSARQIDYWVTTGTDPRAIMTHYAEATGKPPMLPEWASGFWQSKLRYRTQAELMAVAREHCRRGLPLSVIVTDFFHWSHLGDWRFDPAEWPDPRSMLCELSEMGVRLMVSVWPSVSPLSENYQEMLRRGLFIATEQGPPVHADWADKGVDAHVQVSFYDATNAEARRFVWEQAREHYYALGVRVWWLDACEPELKPGTPQNLLYRAGPGLEVANLYPREHARAFSEGMRAEGETEVVTLCRSAWAGSQRHGAALWSGDIRSTFEALRAQVRAGLNVALSGIPWWTTDIGGFEGGDVESPAFRELIVRWFQYGAFCPLFRLHGYREPRMSLHPAMTGGPNEVWSFGEEAYAIIREVLFLRERLRPYLMAQMRAAHECGTPPMRPLFFDFPGDERAWCVDDAFLLGPDLLVAPVLEHGARERDVYLPAGATWTDAWDGGRWEGGRTLRAEAPLDRVPLFLRDDAELPIHG